MNPFKRNPDTEIEARLRADRAEPGSELVQSIVGRVEGATKYARPRSLRVAFAVVSVGALGALGALGGVSYAASSVEHAAKAVKSVFVSSAPKGEAKGSGPLAAETPSGAETTAAGDQYGGPPGPFLPPGVTASDAAKNFLAYLLKATADHQRALGCNALTGAARTACRANLRRLQALYAAYQRRLNAALAQVGNLPPARQALAARLLAIHLLQQQRLADAQATRRANCAGAAYRRAHAATCAKANPVTEAAERQVLGALQLAELEAFLAG